MEVAGLARRHERRRGVAQSEAEIAVEVGGHRAARLARAGYVVITLGH